MRALKYQVTINKDRRVVLDLPASAGEGPAEVILLIQDGPNRADSLSAFLADMAARPRGRSQEDINRYINEERQSWD